MVRKEKGSNREPERRSPRKPLSEHGKKAKLSRELAKLDPREEKRLAEEGLGDECVRNDC